MKKYDYPIELSAMHMMEEGQTISQVEKATGIYHYRLARLWHRFQSGGELAILPALKRRRLSCEEKLGIVRSITEKNVSLVSISVEMDIDYSVLKRWLKAYNEHGPEAFMRKKAMSKKTITEEQLEELEQLRKRNEYLEAENALLKKVRALVEERESRLRAIGRKPSKN